ncbi:MAG: RNA polymerase sigma factor [Myxococcota bacterium]
MSTQRSDEPEADIKPCHTAALRFFQNKVFGAADAEDLTQETIRRFLATDRTRVDNPRLFILGIARRVLLEYIRRKSKRQTQLEDQSLVEMGAGPSTMVAKDEQERLLHDALRRLPLHLQTLLELHYWEGLNLREISEVLDKPYGTCTRWAHDAKRELRIAMQATGGARGE